LSKNLGADPATFGQLQTVFAVAQLLGGPGNVLKKKVRFGGKHKLLYFTKLLRRFSFVIQYPTK
jgi:hypothetical protein